MVTTVELLLLVYCVGVDYWFVVATLVNEIYELELFFSMGKIIGITGWNKVSLYDLLLYFN
ncbi:MAG: hypothetical protein ACI8RD_001909 [Bacillariaceae sp.]|jgi:hypothetical protein